MLWITTTPGSAVQSKGSMVCMIGGVGNLPSKVARTKSIPAIDAMTSVGVTPYSILRGDGASMGAYFHVMMIVILNIRSCNQPRGLSIVVLSLANSRVPDAV